LYITQIQNKRKQINQKNHCLHLNLLQILKRKSYNKMWWFYQKCLNEQITKKLIWNMEYVEFNDSMTLNGK